MIVDDNKHMRSMVRNILRSFGILNIVDAPDGASAYKLLLDFPADVIVCDWQMKPMNGLEFTKMVRTAEDSPCPFVSIIMLTGHTEISKVVEARDSGVNEFLAKPVSAKKLYSRLETIIERPRPFVRAGEYFGPDRRRKTSSTYQGPERRKAAAGSEGAVDTSDMTPEEIQALLNG